VEVVQAQARLSLGAPLGEGRRVRSATALTLAPDDPRATSCGSAREWGGDTAVDSRHLRRRGKKGSIDFQPLFRTGPAAQRAALDENGDVVG